jgi:hypothetical protein
MSAGRAGRKQSLISRYRRLSLWNKIALWASLITFLGLALYVVDCVGDRRRDQLASRRHQQQLEALRTFGQMNKDRLLRMFPMGYVLFYEDDIEWVRPATDDRLRRFNIDWGRSAKYSVTPDAISVTLPEITDRDAYNFFGFRRGVATRHGFPFVRFLANIEVFSLWIGAVKDDSTGVIGICAFGELVPMEEIAALEANGFIRRLD